MNHATGKICLYNINTLCDIGAQCDMWTALCDMRSALCYIRRVQYNKRVHYVIWLSYENPVES